MFDLPILFVCEDNGFAATTRTAAHDRRPGCGARAESLGIPALEVDGNDVLAVDAIARELIDRLRRGEGPQFLLAHTYRLAGHTAADPAAYRPQSEVDEQRLQRPDRLLAWRCCARPALQRPRSRRCGAPPKTKRRVPSRLRGRRPGRSRDTP